MLHRTDNFPFLQAGALLHKVVQTRVPGASLFFLPKSKTQISTAKNARKTTAFVDVILTGLCAHIWANFRKVAAPALVFRLT